MRVSDPRRGGILFGLVLCALVVVCLALAAGTYVVRNVRVEGGARSGRTDVSIETPAGRLSIRAHDRMDAFVAGVPIYPGARSGKHPDGAEVDWTSRGDGDNKNVAVSAVEVITDDPVDRVAEYYRQQLPDWTAEAKRDGSVVLELHEGGYKRVVAIHEREGRTHIGVASVGEPASN